MSKKSKNSPWGAFKANRKADPYISTNVPINKMSEVEEPERKAIGRYAHEAWQKESDLKNAIGPASLPDPWYSKTLKALKRDE